MLHFNKEILYITYVIIVSQEAAIALATQEERKHKKMVICNGKKLEAA